MLFELSRDVSLASRRSLLPDVIVRYSIDLRLRHLEEVAENRIEPNLQIRDASSLPLLLLETRDIAFAVLGKIAQLVQLGIVFRPDHPAVSQNMRRIGHDRGIQQVGD